jgi:hypothetical protein
MRTTGEGMASFFAAIQNWFSGGFHGRHLGLILQEIGRLQPAAIASFISNACDIPARDLKGARYEAEVSFQPSIGQHYRRADLAVYLAGEETPTILVEIKYYDGELKGTETKPAQFDDYRNWITGDDGRKVLVLSRESYFKAEGETLEFKRWDEFARHLRPYGQKSDLIKMLVDYLEEEGIVMQNVDGYSLMRYFKRLLCHDWNSGVLANNLEGPAEFTRLMKNLKMTSGTYETHFKKAVREAGLKVEGKEGVSKAPTIDFRLINSIKPPTSDELSLIDDEDDLVSKFKNGGVVKVSATHSLGNGQTKYLRIEYGMIFEVSPNDSKNAPPKVKLYAEANGHKLHKAEEHVWHERSIKYDWVTDLAETSLERVETHLTGLLRKAIDEVVEADLPLEQHQKKALKLLQKSLAIGC